MSNLIQRLDNSKSGPITGADMLDISVFFSEDRQKEFFSENKIETMHYNADYMLAIISSESGNNDNWVYGENLNECISKLIYLNIHNQPKNFATIEEILTAGELVDENKTYWINENGILVEIVGEKIIKYFLSSSHVDHLVN
jgi:hypothetical protein